MKLKQQLDVVVCGNSLFLSGMAASLRRQGIFRVSCFDEPLALSVSDIKMLSPQAVLFEYSDAVQPIITLLLKERPSLRLVGLRPEEDSLVVFSGSEHQVTSAEELARLLAD
jgi:hypothetical protein